MRKLEKLAKKIRRKIIELLYKHNACHLGSCLSCVEILVALYFKIMKSEDKFLLSKGWAAAALYSILAEKGIIEWNDLYENYYEPGSKYWGLVHHTVPGVEHSFGSAGHGLPVAIGMALANKNRRVFCLVSDGEMDCGTTWESALFAAHHKLDNLVVLVDYNKFQAFGKTNEVLNLESLAEKWRNFNWVVYEIDGHNFGELLKTLKKIPSVKGKPHILICHTIKGKGISFYENKLESHYGNISDEQYKELKKIYG
ncbi:MAG: transketolase [Candidatus Nealsonbacteria bacterium CG_4_9_14_3_um_filter_37_13]|uniref:Transketolase n=1 Tax=Candidatus Nealsonbacteria bacterium CG_4_9_14_3_um_filter_37_13 TaxID=1974695 RepID=A0A2M7Z4Q1_9BACT|nr:MAG: transketolase [Candidatus Nealsonbacteria bacterium CG_4_9_14_3_um_filter_37_13]